MNSTSEETNNPFTINEQKQNFYQELDELQQIKEGIKFTNILLTVFIVLFLIVCFYYFDKMDYVYNW